MTDNGYLMLSDITGMQLLPQSFCFSLTSHYSDTTPDSARSQKFIWECYKQTSYL